MRTKNPITVLGPDGRPLAGAQVDTRVRATGADAAVYAAETGAGAGANPAITDASGRITQWLERGAYASTITGPAGSGLAPYVEAWDSAPAGDGGVDPTWLPDSVLAVRMFPANSVPYGAFAADAVAAMIPVGACIPYVFSAIPVGGRWDWADGGLIPAGVGQIGEKLLAGAGHAYNGGIDPGGGMVRKPDKRGRGSIGADNFGTAQGAAGRLTTANSHNNARGQNGGAEVHTLNAAQNGPHQHQIPTRTSNYADCGVASAAEGNGDQPMNAYGSRTNARGSIASVDSAGSGTPHNNVHPYEADLWIVRLY